MPEMPDFEMLIPFVCTGLLFGLMPPASIPPGSAPPVNTRFLVLPKKLKKSPVLGAFPPEKHG